jgi:hypothetical protein
VHILPCSITVINKALLPSYVTEYYVAVGEMAHAIGEITVPPVYMDMVETIFS